MKYLFPMLALILLAGCRNSMEDINKIADEGGTNMETGFNVELLYTEMGTVKARLQAPKLIRILDEPKHAEFPDGFKLYLYDENGEIESSMSALYGKGFENSEELAARDSVEVINKDGEIMETEELLWDQQRKKIYSNSYVKITTPDEIIWGTGFEANENMTDYTIKNIQGTINVNDYGEAESE